MKWFYKQPVDIIFGNDTLNDMQDIIKNYKNPIIVTTKHFAGINIIPTASIYSSVKPNPDIYTVNEISKTLRQNKNDVIIAIGGGSAIDAAKAASLCVEDISLYHGTGIEPPDSHIPVIAVPTTAGTGSEVTNVSVITNGKTNTKQPIVADSFYPEKVIIDPKLLCTLPANVTASSGIDVLCHAVEGYWSTHHQPICDALAIYAVKLIMKYLRTAYFEPQNLYARERTAEASVIAGLAFGLPKTTASHACSFPLTTLYNIPHGEACGLTIDYFMKINSVDGRVIQLAKEVGYSNIRDFADDIHRLKEDINLRTSLADLKLSNGDIDILVNKSHHPNLCNNPVKITNEMLYEMYDCLRSDN